MSDYNEEACNIVSAFEDLVNKYNPDGEFQINDLLYYDGIEIEALDHMLTRVGWCS